MQISDQIADHAIEDSLYRFVKLQFLDRGGIDFFGFAIITVKHRNATADLGERKQMRFKSVVEIGGVVGDFVSQVDELSLEWRTLVEQVLGRVRETDPRNNHASA